MFRCNMIHFYDSEEYYRLLKKFEAERHFDDALLVQNILITTHGSFTEYCEDDFWYYQPAKPFPVRAEEVIDFVLTLDGEQVTDDAMDLD
jgi:hypothetical protein